MPSRNYLLAIILAPLMLAALPLPAAPHFSVTALVFLR